MLHETCLLTRTCGDWRCSEHPPVFIAADITALQVVGSPDKAEAAILEACKDDATARMLYSLGIQLGIPSWQQHWLQCCTHSIPQNQDTAEPSSYTANDSKGHVLPERADASQTHDSESASTSVELESILKSMRSLTMKIPQGADDTSVPQSRLAAISNTSNVTDEYKEDQHRASSEESLECQKFIQSIRQSEFGIGMGVDLSASEAELRQKMNDRLGRALHRLSQDLYSKDVHFVLELVQNADDNAYEADVWPAVKFILQAQASPL